MGLVFTRERSSFSLPLSLPPLRRGYDGPSAEAVSTSTGEVLARNRRYRLLDLGPAAPGPGGDGCLSMWPVVCVT